MKDVGFTEEQYQFRESLIRGVIESKTPKESELEFTGIDGRQIYEYRVFPEFDSQGKIQSVLTINRKITQRKLAEDEIRKLNLELEQRVKHRTAQLEATNKELEAFSYSVSHDLRAPLRHISGFTELLYKKYKDTLPDQAQHYIDVINSSVRQMGLLIDDLLQFSRTGKAEMHISKIDMQQLVQETKEFLADENPQRQIIWDIDDLPSIHGDLAMMRLVWINLLSNALKYSRTREITYINIWHKEDVNQTIYYVKDNGVGFDMKYADKLFGVFQRLHTSEEFEGSGIGLANVRRIITRHGGWVHAKAEPDKGATFYFALPDEKKFSTYEPF
jgi:light-regulated signal transduction histidine kinase (bacteriophytochrome)